MTHPRPKTPTPTPLALLRPAGPLVATTHDQVIARMQALASLSGREPGQVQQADYAQARVELDRESATDRHDALLAAAPESQRWDPVPGSPGHQAPESPEEEEDGEGRVDSARLAELGIARAEQDRRLAALLAAVSDARRG